MFSIKFIAHATFFSTFMSMNTSGGMDESTLLIRCKKGDPRAQRALFEKFAPKMLAVCMRYVRSGEQAQDVLQDAFVKVFTKLDNYSGDGSLEGWIRRVVVNTALDQIRRDLKFRDDLDVEEVGYRLEQTMYQSDSFTESDLMKLISAMPDGYRVVFNMFAIEGFSHREIAETLNVSENTSKSQYSRARAYLQERLKEIGFER